MKARNVELTLTFTPEELFHVRAAMYIRFRTVWDDFKTNYNRAPYDIELWSPIRAMATKYRDIVDKCNKALAGIYEPLDIFN